MDLNPIEELAFEDCHCLCNTHGHDPIACTGLASGKVTIVKPHRTPVDVDMCGPCRTAFASMQTLDAQVEA